MATFPTYAQIMVDGYSLKRESALLRSEMESGPPKQAKIKTRVMVKRSIKIYLDSYTNYQNFMTWFANDINQGADFFDMPDPITQTETISARFVGGDLSMVPLTHTNEHWSISAEIETWSA